MNRRSLLAAVAAATAGAVAGPSTAAASTAKPGPVIGPACEFTWPDVVASAGWLYRIALGFAQCQGLGDEETTCQLMLAAINEITEGRCPGDLSARDLGLITGGR